MGQEHIYSKVILGHWGCTKKCFEPFLSCFDQFEPCPPHVCTRFVKFPLCILFLCLKSLSILWLNLFWCLFLVHFRYTKISEKKTRPRLQDEH